MSFLLNRFVKIVDIFRKSLIFIYLFFRYLLSVNCVLGSGVWYRLGG